MLNYEIDPTVLAPLVPRGTLLDAHAGRTYVSMVGFLFLRTRVLGVPIPFHRHFEEVNLRFYVRRVLGDEVRRGVCFIREIVPKWAIATTARWTYNEPYLSLPMRHRVSGPVGEFVARSANWRCREFADDQPPGTIGMAGAMKVVGIHWRSRTKENPVRLTRVRTSSSSPNIIGVIAASETAARSSIK